MHIKIYLACISERRPTDIRPPWIFRQGDKFTRYDPCAPLAAGTAVPRWPTGTWIDTSLSAGERFIQYDPRSPLATGIAMRSRTAREHTSIPEHEAYIRERVEQAPKLAREG